MEKGHDSLFWSENMSPLLYKITFSNLSSLKEIDGLKKFPMNFEMQG